jgi:hypothetical protein
MIPKVPNPKRLLVPLSAAAFAFFLRLANAAAGEIAVGSLQRSLGHLIYLVLPLLFYLLMRSRRRRQGASVLSASGRHRALQHHRHRASRGGQL